MITKGFKNDKRFYAGYVSHDKGYGLFADVFVLKGSIIGEYTGVMTTSTANKDYQWNYHTYLKDREGKKVDLAVDSFYQGNMLRFINHDDDPNCDVLQIPWNNRWHTLYYALRPISPGEELTVDYGPSYWTRKAKNNDPKV